VCVLPYHMEYFYLSKGIWIHKNIHTHTHTHAHLIFQCARFFTVHLGAIKNGRIPFFFVETKLKSAACECVCVYISAISCSACLHSRAWLHIIFFLCVRREVCVCVCVCVCACVYIHTYIEAYMCVYVFVHVFECVYIHMYLHVYM